MKSLTESVVSLIISLIVGVLLSLRGRITMIYLPFSCYYSNLDDFVKSQDIDGTVKSSRCKAHEYFRNEAYLQYAAMTKDEAQRRRWTFYEAVKLMKEIPPDKSAKKGRFWM